MDIGDLAPLLLFAVWILSAVAGAKRQQKKKRESRQRPRSATPAPAPPAARRSSRPASAPPSRRVAYPSAQRQRARETKSQALAVPSSAAGAPKNIDRPIPSNAPSSEAIELARAMQRQLEKVPDAGLVPTEVEGSEARHRRFHEKLEEEALSRRVRGSTTKARAAKRLALRKAIVWSTVLGPPKGLE